MFFVFGDNRPGSWSKFTALIASSFQAVRNKVAIDSVSFMKLVVLIMVQIIIYCIL
jgi:hypothetical protein